MLKRLKLLTTVLLAIVLAATAASGAVKIFADNLAKPDNGFRPHDGLLSDNGYIDYAKDVYLDVESYPDLAEMGLFWTQWDTERDKMVLKDADTAEGAALIDPNKPTIILVHGMLGDGHIKQESFYLSDKISDPDEFGLQSSGVPLGLLWQELGWNVGYFHYNRFGAEGFFPHFIECKIWAIDGESGIRYRHSNNTTTNNATQYSIAEHFAAEYIRAMNLLPANMGNKEIRVAAHSMGGEVCTAGLFVLTLLADDGQLAQSKLPSRFAMLDPYFSTSFVSENNEVLLELSPKDITIRWSGKPLPYNSIGLTMIDCIKYMVYKDIAIEYYTYSLSWLVVGMSPNLIKELKKLCVYTIIEPDYNYINPAYSKAGDGHNGVRDWYLCSMYSNPVVDQNGNIAASAATPTATIKELKGNFYTMYAGSRTVIADDDVFKLEA